MHFHVGLVISPTLAKMLNKQLIGKHLNYARSKRACIDGRKPKDYNSILYYGLWLLRASQEIHEKNNMLSALRSIDTIISHI